MNKEIFAEFEKEALPHIDSLYNFALGLDADNAEKLLKETFLKASYFWDKIERGNDTEMWLFRIMWNSFSNPSEKIKRIESIFDIQSSEVEKSYKEIKASYSGRMDRIREIVSNIETKELKSEINSLHENYRVVITLCDMIGFSYEEISDLIDLPVEVIAKRLFSGRILLLSNLLNLKM